MDDPENTYAPQSPDLSSYHSSYVPQQHYRGSFSQPSYDPALYYPQQQTQQQQSQMPQYYDQNQSRLGVKEEADDEYMPDTSTPRGPGSRIANKKAKKVPKLETDALAPGIAEGIEVKTKFPVARIKRIMQADEDVGKVAQVTPIAVSKALELFMISLVGKASQEAKIKSSKRITAAHLKQAIVKDNQFDFLEDIIAKIPDAPAPSEKVEDGEASDGKKKRGGGRRKRKDNDDS
ncbi:MAG: hypothetical protein M1827_002574 [Pycnora praestabilis]|nr:MAG: hypothetical protein M1827_002574 [Pycnora praestabilis]